MTIASMPNRRRRFDAPAAQPEAVAVRPHVEAPDSGESYLPIEAPEATAFRHAEAPDAGSGRSFEFESEFTQGRSRS